jgi:hypothetical protein
VKAKGEGGREGRGEREGREWRERRERMERRVNCDTLFILIAKWGAERETLQQYEKKSSCALAGNTATLYTWLFQKCGVRSGARRRQKSKRKSGEPQPHL